MTTIREKSTAVLAEAMELSGLEVDETTLTAHEAAEAVLTASPTLARRLDFATAWDEAVAALPEWRRGPALYPWRDEWWAHAYDLRHDTDAHAEDISRRGPTPTDALVALREALEARQ